MNGSKSEQELHPEEKYCPRCEQTLHPEDRFCPQCGSAVSSEEEGEGTRTGKLSYVGLIGLAAIGAGLLCIALIFVSIFRIFAS